MATHEERQANKDVFFSHIIHEREYLGIENTDSYFTERAVSTEVGIYCITQGNLVAYRNQVQVELAKLTKRSNVMQEISSVYKPLNVKAIKLKGKIRVVDAFKKDKEILEGFASVYSRLHVYLKDKMKGKPTPDLNALEKDLVRLEEKVNKQFNVMKEKLQMENDEDIIKLESVPFGLLERLTTVNAAKRLLEVEDVFN